MALAPKQMIYGSLAAAGVVVAASVLDLATGMPFAGQPVMDIMFIVSAAIVFYLGWDALKEQT